MILNKVVMAKRRAVHHKTLRRKDDRTLMLLAAAAAIIVGFVAIFAYKSSATLPLAMYSPTPSAMTIVLNAQNGSKESGTATLQEVGGKVQVTLSLTGFVSGVSQPAHIHVGSCPNPGAVKYPLTSVLNGQSVTTIDTTLSALKSMGKLAVNVHKSAAQSSIYYSCGDL